MGMLLSFPPSPSTTPPQGGEGAFVTRCDLTNMKVSLRRHLRIIYASLERLFTSKYSNLLIAGGLTLARASTIRQEMASLTVAMHILISRPCLDGTGLI